MGIYALVHNSGILFIWQTFARRKWTYQNMLVIAFLCFAFYLAYFYFRIDYNIPKESLYLPVIAKSAGYVMVAVMMLTANTRLPFPFIFLHGLSFQNMFSAALAAPIGNAIVGRALKVIMTRNSMLLSQNMDSVTLSTNRTPMGELYGIVQAQSLMESMKEVYGLLLLWLYSASSSNSAILSGEIFSTISGFGLRTYAGSKPNRSVRISKFV